jgi:hypothetical protein
VAVHFNTSMCAMKQVSEAVPRLYLNDSIAVGIQPSNALLCACRRPVKMTTTLFTPSFLPPQPGPVGAPPPRLPSQSAAAASDTSPFGKRQVRAALRARTSSNIQEAEVQTHPAPAPMLCSWQDHSRALRRLLVAAPLQGAFDSRCNLSVSSAPMTLLEAFMSRTKVGKAKESFHDVGSATAG